MEKWDFQNSAFPLSVDIFLAKEPKVTQLSVLLHISISECYVPVMLDIDLESTQISGKISVDLQVSAMSVDGSHSI